MLILGLILLIVGLIWGYNILTIIGIVCLIIGAVLLLWRPGNRYYY